LARQPPLFTSLKHYFNEQAGDNMTISRNAVILVLTAALAALGYLYYQSRQSVIEIKLPSVKIEKQP
jgi:hypothetical protein